MSWGRTAEEIGGRAAPSTIKRRAEAEGWIRPDGLTARPTLVERQLATAHTAEANRRRWVDEKDRIASRLIGLADRLIDEVTAPHEMIDIKVLGGGKDSAATVETVRTQIPSPVPADKQRLVTSAAIVLDKLLLLSGEATSRSEQIGADRDALTERAKQLRDELAERRAAAASAAGEAATG